MDATKETAKKPSAENGKAKEKEQPSEPKKPKKQVKHIDLPVESTTFSLSKADLNAVMEKEVSILLRLLCCSSSFNV